MSSTYRISCDMVKHPKVAHDITFDAKVKLQKEIQKLLDKAEKEKWSNITVSTDTKGEEDERD